MPPRRAGSTRLRADGAERDRAVRRLHELLLRATRFEVGRRAAASPWLRAECEDLAQQSADDALMAVLAKLDDYRGASRFTTWVYKFALLEAGAKTRRRAWHGRQIALDTEDWRLIADRGVSPDRQAETNEQLVAVRDAIDEELTDHQREILVAITLNDVPIDVLAERLSTTRGALYKTLHDARRKLRARLTADNWEDIARGSRQGRRHGRQPTARLRAIARLRGDRRRSHGSSGRPQRFDRLAVPARSRLAKRLRGHPRPGSRWSLRARARGAVRGHAPIRARHQRARDDVHHRGRRGTRHRCDDATRQTASRRNGSLCAGSTDCPVACRCVGAWSLVFPTAPGARA